jgi:glycosyltransferase involved in cell wall biosynthesis
MISVLFPVYNGLTRYPEGQLRRMLTKTLAEDTALEIVIVDDGSGDGTADYLREAYRHDPRVNIIALAENGGIAGAMNAAAKAAIGDAFIVQTARSWYEPGALAEMKDALLNSHAGFVYGYTQYHGISSQLHIPPPFNPADFLTGFASLFGIMYRARAWECGCRYRDGITAEGRHIDVSDYDHALQLIYNCNYTGYVLPRLCLNYIYSGAGQMTELVHRHQAQLDALMRERWQHVGWGG